MTDLTPAVNVILKRHDSRPITRKAYRLEDLDDFLREAYSINKSIVDLHSHLRRIRKSYLSASLPSRRKHAAPSTGHDRLGKFAGDDTTSLTSKQREEIDAEAKGLLRELNAAIQRLQDAEKVRQDTLENVALRRRATKGFGAAMRWASGGAITAKSPEEEAQEAKANTFKMHREGVIFYLQRQLEECGSFQSEMMEARLSREVEKSKSVLAQATASTNAQSAFMRSSGAEPFNNLTLPASSNAAQMPDYYESDPSRASTGLTEEQLQLFEEENQDMLRYYEDTLDQVKNAERSLLEISELQTTLATNLATQSAHIDQLVEDSYLAEENIGSGNKELKKATERKSTAQMVFYSTSIFCATLIVWDLIF